MKLFDATHMKATVAKMTVDRLATLMAGKYKMKKSQYQAILSSKDTSWDAYKKNKNTMEKQKIRNSILAAVISSEFKKEVTSYRPDVADRIYLIILTALTALKNLGVITNTVFIGGKFTTKTYATHVDHFKLLISRDYSFLAKSFLKLNLALPKSYQLIEHSGFGFMNICQTYTSMRQTAAQVPTTLENVNETLDEVKSLLGPIGDFIANGNVLAQTLNMTMMKLLEIVNNLVSGLSFILMPALRVLIVYFLQPKAWRTVAGLSILEIFIKKTHLVPTLVRRFGNWASTVPGGKPFKNHNKNNKNTKTTETAINNRTETETLYAEEHSGIFESLQSAAVPGSTPGTFMNFVMIVLSAIFIFSPETQNNKDSRRDGASDEEYEKNALDRFYDYLAKTEEQFDKFDAANKRSENIISRMEAMTSKTIKFLKGEKTAINVTDLSRRVGSFNENAEKFFDMDIMPIIHGDAKLSPTQLKQLRLFSPAVEGRAGLDGGLSHVLADKIEQMVKEGNKLVEDMITSKQRTSGVFATLTKNMQRLTQMSIQNSDKFVRHGTTERCEPMFLVLSGPPGRGKSNCLKYLHQGMFHVMGYTTNKEQRYNMDNQVHFYSGEKHFNGYKGQLIFSLDDAGQKLGSKSQPLELFEQLIHMINNTPYNVPMAHLDDKNRMFTSEIVTATTNVKLLGTPEQGGINDPLAFQRRITFEFKLEADPRVIVQHGWCKVSKRYSSCVDQDLVEKFYGTRMTPDIWQFIPLNRSSKEFQPEITAGGNIFKCPPCGYFKYADVIAMVSHEYAARKMKFFHGIKASDDLTDYLQKMGNVLVDTYGDGEVDMSKRAEAFKPQSEINKSKEDEIEEEEDEFFEAEQHTGNLPGPAQKKWCDQVFEDRISVCPYGMYCPSKQEDSYMTCDKVHSSQINQLKHVALVQQGKYNIDKDRIVTFDDALIPLDGPEFQICASQTVTWNTYLQDIVMGVKSHSGVAIGKIQNTWDKFSRNTQEIMASSTAKFKSFATELKESTWAKWLAVATGALTLIVSAYGLYKSFNARDTRKSEDKPKGKPMHFKGSRRAEEHTTSSNRVNRRDRVARLASNIGCSTMSQHPAWEPARCRMSRLMNSTFEIVAAVPNNNGMTTNGVSEFRSTLGCITFLRGLAGICAKHVSVSIKKVFQKGGVIMLINSSYPNGVRVNQHQMFFHHADMDYASDMSVFVVAEQVMANCPDMTQLLKTEPETMGFGGRVPVQAFRLSAFDGEVYANSASISPCHSRIHFNDDKGNKYTDTVSEFFWLSNGGIKGHSGGTVVMMRNDGRACFVGIYRGALNDEEPRGLGVKQSNAKLLAFFNSVCDKREVVSWEIPEFYNKPSIATDKHYDGDFKHLASAPKPVFAPTKTQYTPSPIHGMVAPVVTAPAALKPFTNSEGVKVKPSVNAIAKYGKENHYIDDGLIEVVLEAEFQSLQQTSYNKELAKVFSLHDAIYGAPGIQYLDAINASSSCGTIGRELFIEEYGPQEGTINNNSYKLKADYEMPNGDMVNVILYRETNKMRDLMLQGKRPFVMWEDMPKDEPRPLKKVEAGKTRFFSCTANLAYLVMFRQYFGGFCAATMQNKITNGYSVGTNVYGADWDETVSYVTAFGEENIFAGDFAGFDASHNRRLNLLVVDKINKYFYPNATWEENRIRKMLWYDIVESVHVHEGDIYQWLKGQPSGNPITTILNCIVNNTSMRMVWDSVWKEAQNETMRPQFQFNKYVRHVSYGDDSITAVHDKAIAVYNQISVARHQPRFGFDYTDEAKGENGDMVAQKHIREITYLKRSFVKDNVYGHYIAPLALPTLNKMTQWVKTKGDDPNTQCVQRCETAVREAALHSTEVFTAFRAKVVDALEEKGLLQYARIPHDQHAIRQEIRYASADTTAKMVDLSNL